MKAQPRRHWRRLRQTVPLMTIAVCGSWVAAADPADQRVEFSVPAVQAADSIHTFAAAAKLNYFFRDPAAEHVVTNAVRGTFTPDDALEQMLTGTPLTFEKLNERTIALRICGTPVIPAF